MYVLQLLFGLPLIAGVCITALDVILLLLVHGRKFRVLEAVRCLRSDRVGDWVGGWVSEWMRG